MLEWSVLLAQLDAHATTFALTEQAKQGLEACFASMEEGSIDGWTLPELRAEFHSHQLAFRHAEIPPFIETRLALLHARDGYHVGFYRSISSFEGVVTDDFLTFEGARLPR